MRATAGTYMHSSYVHRECTSTGEGRAQHNKKLACPMGREAKRHILFAPLTWKAHEKRSQLQLHGTNGQHWGQLAPGCFGSWNGSGFELQVGAYAPIWVRDDGDRAERGVDLNCLRLKLRVYNLLKYSCVSVTK